MPLGKLTRPSDGWVQRVPHRTQSQGGDDGIVLLVQQLVGAPDRRGFTAIRVELGGFEGRTKAVRNAATLAWNEAFFLPLRVQGRLTLRAFAEDGHSDQMWATGVVDVPLGPLQQPGRLALHVPLFGEGVAAGRLEVELQQPTLYRGRTAAAPSVYLTVVDVRDLKATAAEASIAVRLHLGRTHTHTVPRPAQPRVQFGDWFELPYEGGQGLQLLNVHLVGSSGKVLATGTAQVDTTGITSAVQQLVPVYDKATQLARVNVLIEAWDTRASKPESLTDASRGGDERLSHTRHAPPQSPSPTPTETVIELTVIQALDLPTRWTAGGVMVGVALDSSPPVLTAPVVDRTDPTFSEGFEFANATTTLPPCLEVFLFQAQQPTIPVAYGSLPLDALRSGVAVQEWVPLSTDGQPAGSVLLEVTARLPALPLPGPRTAGAAPTRDRGSAEPDPPRGRPARRDADSSDKTPEDDLDSVAQLEAQIRRVEAKVRDPPSRPAPAPREEMRLAEPDGLSVLVRKLHPALPPGVGPTHVEVALLAEATRTGDSDRAQWEELLALTVPADLPDAKAVLHVRLISSRTGDTLGAGQVALPEVFLPGTGQGEADVLLARGYTTLGHLRLELTLTDVATAQAAAAATAQR
eukprot:EG_transcript_6128